MSKSAKIKNSYLINGAIKFWGWCGQLASLFLVLLLSNNCMFSMMTLTQWMMTIVGHSKTFPAGHKPSFSNLHFIQDFAVLPVSWCQGVMSSLHLLFCHHPLLLSPVLGSHSVSPQLLCPPNVLDSWNVFCPPPFCVFDISKNMFMS